MNDIIETASLLPYMKTDGTGFHIKVSVAEQNDSAHQKSLFPFLVVSDSGPFSRIIESSINTDALTQIEPVFLLTQKDEYPLIKDELWPIDNRSIDQYWQRTFTFHSREKFGSPPLILRGQISKKGQLLPYQPLLFCKYKQIYFQPLCPDCGMSLQQCYNDAMLEEYGLLPYSGSLKRYLFCSSCVGSKEMPDFYVSSLAANDPGFLKNRFELIKKYGQLKEIETPDTLMPCLDCTRHQECYGAKCLAVSRIAAFSFYPFYMLIFKADSINALDFISLMSGASYEEIKKQLIAKQQPGRLSRLKVLKQKGSIETPFFFINEDRYFLEVLYLKLSFLNELSEAIFAGLDTFQYTGLGLSIDRIWVKLSDQNGLLPSFWNFKIELLDVIDADVQSLSFPKLPQSNGLHLLGAIWLYTLLVNKKQDVSHVYGVIGEAIEKNSAKDNAIFEKYLINGLPKAFPPENIFWNPEIFTVNEKWHKFWELSLRMGINLIEGNLQNLKGWSKEDFGQKLKQLRQQIKDNLFSSEPFVPTKESTADDKTISNILIKIMDTWREDVETPQDELAATVSPANTDITGNDLRHQDFKSKIDANIYDTSVYNPQEDTDIKETIIITPNDRIAKETAGIKQDEDPNKTVLMINADTKITDTKKAAFQPNDHLEETIRPSNYVSGKERRHPVKPEGDLKKTFLLTPEKPKKPDESDLPETLIISPLQSASEFKQARFNSPFQDIRSDDPSKTDIPPDEGMAGVDQKLEKPDKDELLEETIIIRSKKTDPGKKG
ncbi:MAG: hypothetical protein MUO88_23225 [Desulfobacterales bacterium]|nr:hypothetical protein [Desulfobacterales bacterium]